MFSKNKTDKIRIIVHTNEFKIIGNIHIQESIRLSDILNSDPEKNFISITDVTVFNGKTDKILYKKEFLALNKNMITLVTVDSKSGRKTIQNSLKDGKSYIDSKDYENAVIESKKVIAIAPDNAEAYYLLGLAYGKMNMINEALKEFENVLKFSTKNTKVYIKAQKIISQIKI